MTQATLYHALYAPKGAWGNEDGDEYRDGNNGIDRGSRTSLGALTFYWSTQAQAEGAALTAVQEHWQLSVSHPQLASTTWANRCLRFTREKHREQCDDYVKEHDEFPPHSEYAGWKLDTDYAWFASHAALTADTVYDLQGDELGWVEQRISGSQEIEESQNSWKQTVRGMIDNHDTYLLSRLFREGTCHEHEEHFIQYVEDTLSVDNLCVEQGQK